MCPRLDDDDGCNVVSLGVSSYRLRCIRLIPDSAGAPSAELLFACAITSSRKEDDGGSIRALLPSSSS